MNWGLVHGFAGGASRSSLMIIYYYYLFILLEYYEKITHPFVIGGIIVSWQKRRADYNNTVCILEYYA